MLIKSSDEFENGCILGRARVVIWDPDISPVHIPLVMFHGHFPLPDTSPSLFTSFRAFPIPPPPPYAIKRSTVIVHNIDSG